MGRWLLLLAVAALPIAVYAWRSSDDAGAEATPATTADPEAANLYHLYVMPLERRQSRGRPGPAFHALPHFRPAWSPDGDRLAVTEIDCHQCVPEVRLIDLEAERANRRKLGKGLAAQLRARRANAGLRAGRRRAGDDRRRRHQPAGAAHRRHRLRQPATVLAGRDADRVHAPGRNGRWHVWTIQPNGDAPRQLDQGRSPEADPAWSPDGKSIVFARQAQNGLWHLRRGTRRRAAPADHGARSERLAPELHAGRESRSCSSASRDPASRSCTSRSTAGPVS